MYAVKNSNAMLIRCKVNFYPEKRKDKTGKLITENVPITLFFSFEGQRLMYFTGYRIDLDKWDTKLQHVTPNCFNRDGVSSSEINDHLDEIKTKVKGIYVKMKVNGQLRSIPAIRDELKDAMGNEQKSPDFYEVWDKFIAKEGYKWTAGTAKRFEVNKGLLQEFERVKHYKLSFPAINETFFEKYVSFLKDDRNHQNSTIKKNIKSLKWVLNWATLKRFNTNLFYKSYQHELKELKKKQVFALTWEELLKVYNLKIDSLHLDRVRDCFCFCCFTGLRYSDVYNLNRINIKNNHIEFTTVKTGDTLIIELNQYSRAILNKYADVPLPDNKALPVISNQNFNIYLKDLGKLAGLTGDVEIIYFQGSDRKVKAVKQWQLLSTHTGRRTFVSTAVYFDIPTEIIMQWTGHSDSKMLDRYINISGKQKTKQMNKFNDNGKEV